MQILHHGPASLHEYAHFAVLAVQAKDLRAWQADAEEFHHASDIGGFQENLRTCAETLYLSIFEVPSVCDMSCPAHHVGAGFETLAVHGQDAP